ncbi:MAG: cation:proton antiporter [Desulfobulbus sp.]|jgi:Kef-type K+ transport system membrane component KefB/mannitol/fructose-specific phosphotransferase system IIA component (Ntr-type)|uniref:cation:proton antiporter domain-containing protein n=1 Tax=Desulfobulbus sp. TaxID=895 RepID=UPI00283FEF1D|nr:cation:proton antiporter [Desulfobulbus sp.]MDR2548806.1 cation:proton antiporter [Desulfobulbus sp.]
MQPDSITVLLLSLSVLLISARVLGELAHRLRQPAVVGELLAGVLLGPTVLGQVAPEINAFLFPQAGPGAVAFATVTGLAVTLFLMVAGLEVDLSNVWRKGLAGLKVGMAGIVIPFAAGLLCAWHLPHFFGAQPHIDPLLFALFLAIAMSISALPVIVKTLLDLNLYRSDFAVVIVSAAIFNDLVGWVIFAVVLGMIDNAADLGHGVTRTVILALGFVVFVFTAGRKLIHRLLPYVQAYTWWPGGEIGFVVILTLLGASFTEWIGIHAIFGAFFIGMAVGDSPNLRRRSRYILDQFIANVFSPIFFASIGLKVNFIAHFDGPLILAILVLACGCKLVGGALGAKWARMGNRESLAAGFAMNSRGAMEIILGLLALERGIISQELFVALVITAIVTSMMGGPMIQAILRPVRKVRLEDAFRSALFLPGLRAESMKAAIEEMAASVGGVLKGRLEPHRIRRVQCAPEDVACAAIVNDVLLLAAGVEEIGRPYVVVGISDGGLRLSPLDEHRVHVVFLILSPTDDPAMRGDMVTELSQLYRDPAMVEQTLQARGFTDFLALIRTSTIYLRKE